LALKQDVHLMSRPTAVVLTLSLSCSGTLQADDVFTLPAIEVSAPTTVLGTESPALRTQVTAEEMGKINTPEVSDAIKYQPNLLVRKRYIGDRNAPLAIRDMHTTQTARALVMGDGLLLSNFLGSSWNFAPRWSVMQ